MKVVRKSRSNEEVKVTVRAVFNKYCTVEVKFIQPRDNCSWTELSFSLVIKLPPVHTPIFVDQSINVLGLVDTSAPRTVCEINQRRQLLGD